jgi:hypothetical protein
MIAVGIDPGMRSTGLCLYDNGVFRAVTIRPKADVLADKIWEITNAVTEYVRFQAWTECRVDLLVIERMQIYTTDKSKGDPNDLIPLAMLGGAILARVYAMEILLPTPAAWKGQVPKTIHHQRIRAKAPTLGRCSKDALDAVGLVLWGLERHGLK